MMPPQVPALCWMPSTEQAAATFLMRPRQRTSSDALRYKGKRIEAALLLTPKAGGASWLEEHAFLVEHRIGIAELSPNSDSLQNSIIRLLQLSHPYSLSIDLPPRTKI